MIRVLTVWGWVAAVSVSLPSAAGDHTPAATPGLPKVTSHSLSYCQELALRLDGLMIQGYERPPSEVVLLSGEGQRLCADGHLRRGIQRLRRALQLMQPISEER
jgi:hypothetical protein